MRQWLSHRFPRKHNTCCRNGNYPFRRNIHEIQGDGYSWLLLRRPITISCKHLSFTRVSLSNCVLIFFIGSPLVGYQSHGQPYDMVFGWNHTHKEQCPYEDKLWIKPMLGPQVFDTYDRSKVMSRTYPARSRVKPPGPGLTNDVCVTTLTMGCVGPWTVTTGKNRSNS